MCNEQLQRNRKRAYKMYKNRGSNIELGKEVAKIRDALPIENELTPEVIKYCSKLFGCGSNGLYRTHTEGATFIHALRCRHKLCFICNAERKRKLRSIYLNFFEDNPDLMENYSFMHLTLTVPHTVAGWAGKKVYNSELLKAFKTMRNEWHFWKDSVYAGQYSVEFTKNKNGLHIHLHALLLVPKAIRRNDLYVNILRAWNNETISETAHGAWDAKRISGIQKSLLCTKDWKTIDSVIKDLDPKGSTLVGLENVYYYVKDEITGKPKKIYGTGKEGLLRGVTECLKYHFEPISMKDEKLVVELLPLLKGQRLYGRFGAFYKDKNLSLAFKKIEEDSSDDNRNEIVNPITGEAMETQDYEYQIHDTGTVRVRKKGEEFTALQPTKAPKYTFEEKEFNKVVVAFGQINKDRIIEKSNDAKAKIGTKIIEENIKNGFEQKENEKAIEKQSESLANLYSHFNNSLS